MINLLPFQQPHLRIRPIYQESDVTEYSGLKNTLLYLINIIITNTGITPAMLNNL